MTQAVETTDIFIGAFLLSHGGSLSGIRIKDGVRERCAGSGFAFGDLVKKFLFLPQEASAFFY